MGSPTKLGARLTRLIRLITIEPIVFFNFLAIPFFHVSQHAILYRSVCLQTFESSEPGACSRLHSSPSMEDRVQKAASAWNMYLSLSYLVPAIASDIFLGAWSDRNGRKISILIGFAGLCATTVAYIVLAVYPSTPLYVLVLANFAAGATGYVAIVLISSIAYLTDVVPNKDKLTFRMIIVLSFRWVADVIGSFTTSILLSVSNPAITMLLAQVFFAAGFFYALLRLYQMPPEELRRLVAAGESPGTQKHIESIREAKAKEAAKAPAVKSSTVGVEKAPRSYCKEFADTLRFIGQMYKEVWRTLARPRKCHRRAHIFICTMVYFSFMVSEVGLQSGPIMSLYVFHRPFNWTPASLGTFRGVQSACGLLGCLIGALINKRLRLDDTTIMLISIASGCVHLTLIGTATATWMLYTATVVGGFYSLLVPSVKACLVRLVDADEVGKTLAANGIAADLAFVVSTLLFTNIYSATVQVYSGSVFLIAAFILICCFGAVLWMRYDRKRLELRAAATAVEKPPASSLATIHPMGVVDMVSMPSDPPSPVVVPEDIEVVRL